ncbi:MAG: hypothetical protein AMS18_02730 [Gemmatimonas sp. SG8_17]|nr:MAG: hypothetical protein AMS18_02730 [Gemmatimonas sp. SG8_17]
MNPIAMVIGGPSPSGQTEQVMPLEQSCEDAFHTAMLLAFLAPAGTGVVPVAAPSGNVEVADIAGDASEQTANKESARSQAGSNTPVAQGDSQVVARPRIPAVPATAQATGHSLLEARSAVPSAAPHCGSQADCEATTPAEQQPDATEQPLRQRGPSGTEADPRSNAAARAEVDPRAVARGPVEIGPHAPVHARADANPGPAAQAPPVIASQATEVAGNRRAFEVRPTAADHMSPPAERPAAPAESLYRAPGLNTQQAAPPRTLQTGVFESVTPPLGGWQQLQPEPPPSGRAPAHTAPSGEQPAFPSQLPSEVTIESVRATGQHDAAAMATETRADNAPSRMADWLPERSRLETLEISKPTGSSPPFGTRSAEATDTPGRQYPNHALPGPRRMTHQTAPTAHPSRHQAMRDLATDKEVPLGQEKRIDTGSRDRHPVTVPAEGPVTSVGARYAGVIDRSVSHVVPSGTQKSGQPASPIRPVELAAMPKPEDRVTLKFTDDSGVDGRVRVAVRGQDVRATIVSGDPAIAERLETRLGELHRALDQHGFRDAQLNVQHVRRTEDAAGILTAAPARPATDSSPGAPGSRGMDEQGSRGRHPEDTRDQQSRNNGRSQHRSRERGNR